MLFVLLSACAPHTPAPVESAPPATAQAPELPDCAPLVDQGDAVTWQGLDHAVLLRADLGGDPRDEWVVEEPDSCGTGGCVAVVLTACGGDGAARPVGALDHWDGVAAGAEATGGWLDLVAAVKSFDADGQPVSAHRVYSWNGSTYAPQ